MRASVIVPSYNSRATVAACLTSLLEQRVDFPYEIVIVDSSDDGTGDLIARTFAAVKLIRLERRAFPGTARNVGIQAASGDILAFTDADCVPEPRWLMKLVRAYELADCAGVGGAVVNARPWNPVAWGGYLLEFSERLPRSPKRLVELLPTCNVAFSRSVFARHGLFPEDLWPSEDHLFSARLIAARERLMFHPGIVVSHIFRPKLMAFLRHQWRLGAAAAIARRRADLPGGWLVHHPVRWTVALVRLLLIESRLARWDWRNFVRFNALFPLCIAGLLSWELGFATAGGVPSSADHRVGNVALPRERRRRVRESGP